MRKLLTALVLLYAFASLHAQKLNFSYNAQADLVSCYIWRGLYNGGLSFQPDFSVGWTSEHTALDFGTWWNVGASDWGFRSGLPEKEDYNPNTQLTKELDIYLSMNLWGVSFGFIHYYYFDGNNFFNFGDINAIEGSAQTEMNLGYDFSTLTDVDLQLMWYTRISGDDAKVNGKRAYSSYIEASYAHHFDHDITLTGVVGVSPWKSTYTDIKLGDDKARDFAVNNLTVRFDKSWSLSEVCELTAFAQGTMNTCNLNKDNALIWASGDDKLEKQKLMGALGVKISFGSK